MAREGSPVRGASPGHEPGDRGPAEKTGRSIRCPARMRPLRKSPNRFRAQWTSGRAPALHACEYLTTPAFEFFPFGFADARRMRPLSVGRSLRTPFIQRPLNATMVSESYVKNLQQKVFPKSARALPELEIRGDEARQADVVERDRIRRVEPDHDVGPGLRHRARQRGVAGEVACRKLQRVVGRPAPAVKLSIVSAPKWPPNSKRSPLEAPIVPVTPPWLASKLSALPQRHVAVDQARVDQGVAAGERHVAIDLPLIHEDVAAGQSDIAGDLTEIVERVPRPAEEIDRAVDLAAVGQQSDRGLRAGAIDRVRPRAAVRNRPGVVQRRDRAGIRESRAAGAACVAGAAVSAADRPAVGQRRDRRAWTFDTPAPPAPPTPAVAPPLPPFPPLIAPLLVSVVMFPGSTRPCRLRRRPWTPLPPFPPRDRSPLLVSVAIVARATSDDAGSRPAPPARRDGPLPPFPPLIVPLLVSVAIVPEFDTPRRRAAAPSVAPPFPPFPPLIVAAVGQRRDRARRSRRPRRPCRRCG